MRVVWERVHAGKVAHMGLVVQVTGYTKQEAQGHNCRFLQGPKTEPEAVAVIQDTLRRGVDCFVKITNYRKNGEQFKNLLSMRPVHDSGELSPLAIVAHTSCYHNSPTQRA